MAEELNGTAIRMKNKKKKNYTENLKSKTATIIISVQCRPLVENVSHYDQSNANIIYL